RNKPPFPTQVGLFGKPTVVDNVETLANVLDIVLEGGPAYARIGTERSTGPKLFCLSGCVARPGVYEVPFGATLRELLDLAGGPRRRPLARMGPSLLVWASSRRRWATRRFADLARRRPPRLGRRSGSWGCSATARSCDERATRNHGEAYGRPDDRRPAGERPR